MSPRIAAVPSPGPLAARTDDELMALAQAGAREAFEALVARHAERLVHTCARMVGDAEAGAELAQETWLAVWTERGRYRAEGKFIVWLLTAARNRCRNHLRHRAVVGRNPTDAQAPSLASASPEQIDRILAEERRRHVHEALGRLPERMREALLLRFAEELRYDEMVEVLDAGESTLRSRVHHGLKMLRDLLEKKR
jgi:RNA polymerase sigma factor (sigma-70 family)